MALIVGIIITPLIFIFLGTLIFLGYRSMSKKRGKVPSLEKSLIVLGIGLFLISLIFFLGGCFWSNGWAHSTDVSESLICFQLSMIVFSWIYLIPFILGIIIYFYKKFFNK